MGTEKKCLIIGAAPETDIEYVKKLATKLNPYIICADGGLSHCKKIGIYPHMLIGDFDSNKDVNVEKIPETIKLSPNKDESDLKECVTRAIKKGFKEFIIVCASGGRLDHYLSNLSLLEYIDTQEFKAVFMDNKNKTTFHRGGKYIYKTDKNYKYITIIPLDEKLFNVTLEGLLYPLYKHDVSRQDIITLSNEAICEEFSIDIEKGRSLIIFSND